MGSAAPEKADAPSVLPEPELRVLLLELRTPEISLWPDVERAVSETPELFAAPDMAPLVDPVPCVEAEPETPLVEPERSTVPEGLPAVELDVLPEPVPVTFPLELAPVDPVAELLLEEPALVVCAMRAVAPSTVVIEIRDA